MGMLLRRHYKERELDKNVKPEVAEEVTEVKKEVKQAEDKPKKAKASDK